MKTIYLKFLCLFVIMMFSCNKNEDNLPQLPTGENTAYYYLNGEIVIPTGRGIVPPTIKPIYCYQDLNSYNLSLNAKSNSINIFIKSPIEIGIENINNYDEQFTTLNSNGRLSIQDSNSQWSYYNTKNESGKISILEISTNKKQFKGTFEMNVFDSDGNEFKITNGHFNINLDTL